jgi:phage-related protein
MVSSGVSALQNLIAAVQPVVSVLSGLASGGIGAAEALQMLNIPSGIADGILAVADGIQQIAAVAAGVVSQLGGLATVITGVTGALAGVGAALAGFIVLPAIAGAASAALAGIGAALAFLLSPIGLVIAGAALLGAAYASNLGGIRDAISQVAAILTGIFASALQAAGQIAASVFAALPGLIQTAQGVFASLASFVGSVLVGAFQVIGPIASAVFAGIAAVASAALPGLFALANAVGSLLSAAFNALQGVASAVFNAILPYIPALQSAIGTLANALGSVLGVAFQSAASFITGTVIPAVAAFGQWLASVLPGAIAATANFIGGTLVPILANLATWVGSQLPGVLSFLAGVWQGVLLPALAAVGGWIVGTLIPMLGQLMTWLASNIPAALQTLSGVWTGVLLPAISAVWEFVQGSLVPLFGALGELLTAVVGVAVEVLAGLWENVLQPALATVWALIQDNVIPVFGSVADMISSTAAPAVDTFASVVNMLGDAFNGVRGVIAAVTGAISSFAAAITNVQIPDFLQRHSPSPLEQTFMGLAAVAPQAGAAMAGFGGQARAIGDLRSIFITVADAARDMFDIFAGKAAGIGGNAVKKIDRLVDTISSISDAVGDMVKMIEVLKNAQKTLNLAGLLNDSAGQSQIVTWVNSLTAMGRRMVEAAKQASLSLSQSTVDEFKRLADAINSVTSIATGTVALVQAMLGALKFDWAGFDTATAAAGLGKIAGIASELVKAAAGAAVAIKNVDTSGLAPLKEAADNTLGVVTSTLALVQALGDALKVDWGAIDFAEAGRMMHDLAGMVVYFAGKAQEASLAIAKIDTTGLGPLKTAADALIGIADDARSLVEKLVDALTVKWGDIDWPAAGRMMHDLAQMAVYFVGKAAEAAAGLKDIDASGLAPLASLA